MMYLMAGILVEDMFDIKGRGVVVTGRVTDGSIYPDMSVVINGKTAYVKGLETFRKKLDSISAGDPDADAVGLLLENVQKDADEAWLRANRRLTFFRGEPSSETVGIPKTPARSSPPPPAVMAPPSSRPVIIFILLAVAVAAVYFFFFSGSFG